MIELSARDARRVALAATGLAGRRPSGLAGVVAHTRVLQIDSVNVAVRAHEMPPYSRSGPYDRSGLARFAYRQRRLFEYWAHEAAYTDVTLWPLFRHRMIGTRDGQGNSWWAKWISAHPGLLDRVRGELRERGPLPASALTPPGRERGTWWSWGDEKRALEFLFMTGEVTAHSRLPSFERVYDFTERVLPGDVLGAPVPAERDARAALLLQAADALGVATDDDVLDYFRQHRPTTRPILRDLVDAGDLVPAQVAGWAKPAFTTRRWLAERPARATGRTLLSPFDPVVWHRPRAERLFRFHYRIEIYVPAPKRVYGYYVMPFLLGDRLVARVDVKADRHRGVLSVPGAFAEPNAATAEVTDALAAELQRMAAWLGLGGVEIGERGDLAPALAAAVGS